MKEIIEPDFVYIYSLIDPRDNIVRYVGKSKNIKMRLSYHTTPSKLKKNTHKNNWIKQLLSLGLKPTIIILETVYKNIWKEKEKYWINFFGRENLTNGTDGGEGSSGATEETRNIISEKARIRMNIFNPFKGKHHSDKIKTRLSETHVGIKTKKNSRSKYVGLHYDKRCNIWFAKINFMRISYSSPGFKYEMEAAMAWNEMALDLYGWKIKDRLNKITQEESDKLWEEE